jgi:hypothetical protein
VSILLAAAWLIQIPMITLLRRRLGDRWLLHPASVLLLASTAYLEVSPLLMASSSVRASDTYRTGIQQSDIDCPTPIMSAGMLTLTVAYLLTPPGREVPKASQEDVRGMIDALDWR